VKGKLYGTTESVGANGGGTVFSFDPNTGTETVLYSFCGQENYADGFVPGAGLLNVKGILYGTTIRARRVPFAAARGISAERFFRLIRQQASNPLFIHFVIS
jgi:uncharacterized repeat protein (TIGR03803 family)